MNAVSHDTEYLLKALRVAKQAKFTSLNQLIVLGHLSTKDDGDYPSRIARAADVSTAAITGIIDMLEGLGLIEREKDGEDRRTRRIRISPSGIQTLAQMLP